MTRQQALEIAARERALVREKSLATGIPTLQARDRDPRSQPGGSCRIESPQWDDERASLTRFADALEGFLETLREAAAYGPNPELAGRYDVLREELVGEYMGLRGRLLASLEPEGPSDAKGIDFHGLWSDPFDRLLRPESLFEALEVSPTATAAHAVRAVTALDHCWRLLRGEDGKQTTCA